MAVYEFWILIGLSILPGAGNFVGGMFAEFSSTSPRRLNLARHAASGIVIGVIAIELMPEALGNIAGWWIAASFAAGGAAYIGIETLIERMTASQNSGDSGSMCMIYIAVSVDLMGDGLMIGSGTAVATSLAVALTTGQVLADIPEGYAVVANLRTKGVSRRWRIAASFSFALFCVSAAVVAWFLLRIAPDAAKYVALSFVAGLLTVAAVEDMLEEAHGATSDTRTSTISFVGGFVLFTLVSAGLDTLMGPSSAPGNGRSSIISQGAKVP